MYYIQTVDHNNKKYNFLCTEQELAFINKEDIYEWKVEDHYLEIRKNNFEEISDFQYELLKKHINFIVFKKLKKRDEKVEFVYYHKTKLMHGDADFYIDELFCISKKDYEFIKNNCITVNFQTCDKTSDYNINIITSLTYGDFKEIDGRLCGITHNLQEDGEWGGFELDYDLENVQDYYDEISEELCNAKYDIEISLFNCLTKEEKEEWANFPGIGELEEYSPEYREKYYELFAETRDNHLKEMKGFDNVIYINEDVVLPICNISMRILTEINLLFIIDKIENRNDNCRENARLITKEELNAFINEISQEFNDFINEDDFLYDIELIKYNTSIDCLRVIENFLS